MNNKELKPTANSVGAFIGRPHIEGNTPYKKGYQNKFTANVVGVAPLGDPNFEENIPASSKACSNPNSKHQTLTSNVAITLIALVITIIVMLILVGVTVSIAINGGLFSTAKKAVTKTEEAKDSELRFMAMANAATHNEEWVYEVEGERIPIPSGFAPTEIEGENSLEEGFVIIDAEGNEFVWIPCTSKNYSDANFDDNDWIQFQYIGGNWSDSQTEKGTISLQNLEERKNAGELTKQGVGFYVARYEAGIPENADFYADSEGDTYYLNNKKNTNKYKPVSKKGYPAWNFINQTNAKTVSENMYSGTSYLIDSHAWNYICKNILKEKAGKNIKGCSNWGNYTNNDTTKYENLDVLYAVHEFADGWTKYADGEGISGTGSKYHKGIIPEGTAPKDSKSNIFLELATGASEDFKAYNIYDMAGNIYEWTTEIGTNSEKTENCVVRRGGSFDVAGGVRPVVFADCRYQQLWFQVTTGFRVVLYL